MLKKVKMLKEVTMLKKVTMLKGVTMLKKVVMLNVVTMLKRMRIGEGGDIGGGREGPRRGGVEAGTGAFEQIYMMTNTCTT